ncbi:MAG: hypothetical protein JWM25_1158 [Thermoleophilia bacterium]|nr:hypothetical protein [Thermoleophilia bacterium]MCZ4496575.1 hypothetical protein [Thermoleophilia bacterium]
MTIKNQTSLPYKFLVSVGDGRPRTTTTGPAPIETAAPGSMPRGAGAWLTASPTSISIPAGEERDVRVRIAVPQGARIGGAYATLGILNPPSEAGEGVPIGLDTQVTFLLRVAGDYRRALDVELTPAGDRFRWRAGTVRWTLVMRNTGDLHENVSGAVVVDGLIAGSRRLPLDSGVLLPGETRTQQFDVELRDAPDVLDANVRIDRDAADDARADSPRVYVLPWWLLVVVGVLGLVVWWRMRAPRTWHAEDDLPD